MFYIAIKLVLHFYTSTLQSSILLLCHNKKNSLSIILDNSYKCKARKLLIKFKNINT